MSESEGDDVRRDADGYPIVTGVSVTKGGFWNDDLEERLIREEL